MQGFRSRGPEREPVPEQEPEPEREPEPKNLIVAGTGAVLLLEIATNLEVVPVLLTFEHKSAFNSQSRQSKPTSGAELEPEPEF